MTNSFLKSGHTPTLFAAFLYFDLSFMVWVMLGPLGVQIAGDLGLTSAQKGLMVATPVLSGALLRIVLGIMVDHLGPKLAGTIGQVVVIVSLLAAWFFGVDSYGQVLALGVALGVAGASFAVALPLASRWYPPQHQGTALGIAGAGNSGTVLAALFAPGLAVAFGWNNVFGLAVLPLAAAFIIYQLLANDSPECPPAKPLSDYLKVLKDRDAWWFMFFYGVNGLSPVVAGYFTAACVFAGSLVRPIGGMVADRIGGIKSLSVMYLLAASLLFIVSFGLPQAWMALAGFVAAMLVLGMGNGAVFQLVPQRFRKEIGVMTGLVGMAGGVGGFYLASSLGFSKQLAGHYQSGLLVFAGLAIVAFIGLTSVKTRWRTTWGAANVALAKI
jgi:MFS transporter, NNP family, nitrate/nitrite transporter